MISLILTEAHAILSPRTLKPGVTRVLLYNPQISFGEEKDNKGMEISEDAIKLSVSWIEAAENALANCGNMALSKEVMKATGKECARQILDDCREILGKKPETVDELLHANNQRRLQKLNLTNFWERRGNTAHLTIDECGCALVKAGLAKPNPTHCLCSAGLWENLFSTVCRGPVSVQVVKAIGFGDDVCEFYVDFVE